MTREEGGVDPNGAGGVATEETQCARSGEGRVLCPLSDRALCETLVTYRDSTGIGDMDNTLRLTFPLLGERMAYLMGLKRGPLGDGSRTWCPLYCAPSQPAYQTACVTSSSGSQPS